MAKAKIKFRASSVGMKEGTLYYQVIHNRVARQIHTTYRLYPSEWDAVSSSIVLPSSSTSGRYSYLLSLQETLEADRKKLLLVIARLDKEAQPYTSDKVVEYFREGKVLHGIIGYTVELNDKLRKIGKRRMADRFTTTINSLRNYLKGNDVPLEDVDGTMVLGYEQWLKERGLCRNTTSFYIRNLRTIYNHAVEEKLVVSSSPFKHVYIGIDKTVKRALPLDIIKQLKDLEKTSQQLHIKWVEPMQKIVAKYQTDDSPYLLPIATGEGALFWKRYKNAYKRITNQLKKIGEMMGLSIPLTTYVARHSWASAAKSKNVALSTISEGLGHDSEKTTRIYLSSLDTSVVDRANNLIINSL